MVCKDEKAPEGMDVDEQWLVKLVDFEWAGEAGKASYPPLMNMALTWGTGMTPFSPMQPAHDLEMLQLITSS